MKLFFKKSNTKQAPGQSDSVVQCVSGDIRKHPFSAIESYVPFSRSQRQLYSSLREAVPVIDAAIGKLVRLTGDFTVECESVKTTKSLNDFLCAVSVNGVSSGVYEFLNVYLDQLLTYGEAVGEIVCDRGKTRICGLYNGSLDDSCLKRGDNPMTALVCRNNAEKSPYACQNLLMYSLLNPRPGSLTGTSVLKGLPFVSSILLKIFNTIGTNFERVGNVRFAVTYRPSSAGSLTGTREQTRQIADEWSKAMRSKGGVCDFVSAGDVSVKVIGADNQVLDCDVPVRHLLEQIVAKLSIPPFLLGLSWSSTERMSSQQTDILTSELKYYRLQLNPIICKICSLWMSLNGVSEKFEVKWNNINLQDDTELSKARFYNARAEEIESRLSKGEK